MKQGCSREQPRQRLSEDPDKAGALPTAGGPRPDPLPRHLPGCLPQGCSCGVPGMEEEETTRCGLCRGSAESKCPGGCHLWAGLPSLHRQPGSLRQARPLLPSWQPLLDRQDKKGGRPFCMHVEHGGRRREERTPLAWADGGRWLRDNWKALALQGR